jgi:hypothetical protein
MSVADGKESSKSRAMIGEESPFLRTFTGCVVVGGGGSCLETEEEVAAKKETDAAASMTKPRGRLREESFILRQAFYYTHNSG